MPLPHPPYTVRGSLFAGSAFLLILCAGMIALMGWSLTTYLPGEAAALRHEQAVWERGVSAVDGSYEGREETQQAAFHTYKLTVRYRDRAGADHTGKLEFSALGKSLDDEGGNREIRYDPAHPDDFALGKALDMSGSRWANIYFFGVMSVLLLALFGWLVWRVICEILRARSCARDGLPVVVTFVTAPERDRYGNTTCKYRVVGDEPNGKIHVTVLKRQPPLTLASEPSRAVGVRSASQPNAVVLLRADGYPFVLSPEERRALSDGTQQRS